MKIKLRIPTMEDKEGLKTVCNAVDRKYLSDRLPYPYTDEAADWWIHMVAENDGKTEWQREIRFIITLRENPIRHQSVEG